MTYSPHWTTVGPTSRSPDPLVLARAIQLGRAVITFNRRHYVRLHRLNSAHAGIVAVTDDPDAPAVATRILAALTGVTDLSGRLIPVDKPSRPRPPKP